MNSIIRTEPDLQRMVTELVSVHVHREPYIVRGGRVGVPDFLAHHQTRVPSLIDQLLEPAPGGKGELGGSEAQARPAVRIEAHDTIALIADEAGEWIDRLGAVIPAATIRTGTKLHVLRGSQACRALVILRALHAGLPGEDRCGRAYGTRIEVEVDGDPESDSKDSLLRRREWCCRAHQIEADVRSWWRQARIIAGWDSPPYRPFATCPVCSKRSGLRINLSSHTAVCVECRTVWGPDTIGLLGEHVRVEREGAEVEGLDQPEQQFA